MRFRTTILSLPLLSLIAGTLASQQPGKPPKSIAGRVLDANGKPVAATVVLRWRAHPELPSLVGYTLGDGGFGEKEFRAEANGRFHIRPPHRGPFLLIAKHARTSSTQVFPVLAGDYHTLRLEPDHVMSGIILDPKNTPLGGATVRLVPSADLQAIRLGLYRQPERRATAKTDVNGRFAMHFEHGYLRDPRWNVLMALRAEHDGRANSNRDYVRPTNGSMAIRIVLDARAAFQLHLTELSTGKPIAGAKIVDPLVSSEKTTTDVDGRCSVRARGGYAFVYAPGYHPAVVTRSSKEMKALTVSLTPGLRMKVNLSGPKGPLAGARVLFAVPRGNSYPFEWQARVGKNGDLSVRSIPQNSMLLAFVEIDGRFVKFYEGVQTRDLSLPKVDVRVDRSVYGRVMTANKFPVAGARVGLQCLATNPNNPRRVTYTDRAGRFRFDGVYASDHQVIAAKGAHGQIAVVVRKHELDQPVTVTLKPAMKITGTVMTPEGKPAAGAWVNLYTSSGGGARIRGPRAAGTCLGTMTDAKGQFEFGVARNSSWSIVAAIIHEGAHCNATASAKAGAKNLVLKTTVANR